MGSGNAKSERESCSAESVQSAVGPRNRLLAPREDRSLFASPPLSDAGAILADNLVAQSEREYDLQGLSLREVSRRARADMLREAYRWTCGYRDVQGPRPDGHERVLLAGHQPQLFHPGVWLKNFALGALAARHAAVPVNLIIDSDVVRGLRVPVPSGSGPEVRRVSVPLDQPGVVVPYEERRIIDRELFAGFGREVVQSLRGLVNHPLVCRYWPKVVARSCLNDNLGFCLAQARHQLEGRWGLETLEVPQSRICQSEAFFWLLSHVLAQLPRFRQVYNQAVHEYRLLNRIRNAAHPVPDLAEEGDWLEAPFWIWSTADPVRRPLYAAARGDEIEITDRHGLKIALPLSAEGDAGLAVARMMELAGQGIKIRSRALATTLWARLALGDLFLHGIGGGKYDQVTDRLIQRFFGLRAPGFMVLSATVYLPVPTPDVRPEELTEIQRQLRDLEWHAERSLDAPAATEGPAQRLAAEKRIWLQTPPTPDNARQRHQALRRINAALQPWVERQRQALTQWQEALRHALHLRRVLAWREYAFCLYPEQMLREFFSSLPGS